MDRNEMSLEEALGLDMENLPDESEADFTVNDLMDIYREDSKRLKEVSSHLEEFIISYESGKRVDREPVEAIYDLKIFLLCSMARLFNPMSTFGKATLQKAIKCREEFETLVGPMTSRITKDNMELFKTVLNVDLMEDVRTGRRQAFGALRTLEGKTYGAAAVVWHIDPIPGEKVGVLRIDWLFVNEKFRGRNLADFLIAEVVALCNETGIEHVSVDFSTENEFKQPLARTFGLWQFSLDTSEDPDVYIRAGDVANLRRLGEFKKGVKSLSSLGEKAANQLFRGFLVRSGYRGYLLSRDLPENYIDFGLSCFTGKPGSCTGLLLVHRLPYGMLRVEYMDCTKGHESDVASMVSAFIAGVVAGYDDNTLMCLTPDFDELSEFINGLCPNQLGQHLIEGILSKPDDDLDGDDIKKILETF